MADYFTDEGTPWARRLWDMGSVLALEELWEAGYWQAHGVLSQTACDWQRNELSALIGPDRGLGDRELRKELTDLLKKPLTDPSPARRRLKEIIGHVRAGYLERWAAAVKVPVEGRVKPERYSRTVASHLLDLGYSAGHLKAWANALYQARATTADIADSAAELARTPAGMFEVLVVLEKVPRRELAEPLDNWLGKGKVVSWLREHGHDTSGVRPGGGFVYQVQARDPFSAAEQARQLVERMTARAQFLRKDRGGVKPLPSLWVAGRSQPVPLEPPARGADVLTLVNEGHLYRITSQRSRIDDALELAAASTVVRWLRLSPAPGPLWNRCFRIRTIQERTSARAKRWQPTGWRPSSPAPGPAPSSPPSRTGTSPGKQMTSPVRSRPAPRIGNAPGWSPRHCAPQEPGHWTSPGRPPSTPTTPLPSAWPTWCETPDQF
ncbi:hypothetical protein [Streptomyces sp. NPDC020996]|uniref:hypothetical protein n=1 Tax=Streptomyces sp. NPDC020996 TaxID=3154791 RepID=UPI0033ED58CB